MRRELLAVCLVLVLAVALAATATVSASPPRGDGDASSVVDVAAPASDSTSSSTTANASRSRDLLESPTRAALYAVLEAAPGTHLARAASQAGVETSTARYHVRVLERTGLVDSEHRLGKKRLFPASASDDHRAVDAAVADPTTEAVLNAVAATEPATVNAVADVLDRSPSTVSEHLSRLADAGVLDRERDDGVVVARLSAAAEARLA